MAQLEREIAGGARDAVAAVILANLNGPALEDMVKQCIVEYIKGRDISAVVAAELSSRASHLAKETIANGAHDEALKDAIGNGIMAAVSRVQSLVTSAVLTAIAGPPGGYSKSILRELLDKG